MGRVPREVTFTFEQGLRTVESPISRRRTLRQLDNVWLSPDDIGALEVIPGRSKIAAGSATVELRTPFRAKSSSGARMNLYGKREGATYEINHVQDDGTEIAVISNSGGPPTISVLGFSAVVFEDEVYFANGTDAGFKSTISETAPVSSAVGVSRPDVTNASLATNAGGSNNVKGFVTYYIAQVNAADDESAISEKLGPIDAGTGTRIDVDLTHADFSGNTYRIYRTTADGAEPFLVTESFAGGATYTDDVADSALGNVVYQHGDQPEAAIIDLIERGARIWGLTAAGDLLWTDAGTGDSWWNVDLGNRGRIGRNDGDIAVGLAKDSTGIYVLKEDHIHRALVDPTPEDITVVEFEPVTQEGRNVGVPSRAAYVSAHSVIALYWNKGVYLLSGGVLNYISRDIEDDLILIDAADEAAKVALGFFPKRRHLYVSVEHSASGYTYIYDMDVGVWIGRLPVRFSSFLQTFNDSGEEVFWGVSSSDGFETIWRIEDESGVSGSNQVPAAEVRLPVFAGSNPSTLKRLLYVKLEMATCDGEVDVDIYEGGATTPVSYADISLADSGQDRTTLTIHTPGVGRSRQYQIGIRSDALSDASHRWKLYSVTYGWHEDAGVAEA